MICQTIKNGIECGFMTKKGCGFNGGTCLVIIDKCEGCGKIIECRNGSSTAGFIRIRPVNGGPGNARLPPTSRSRSKNRRRKSTR